MSLPCSFLFALNDMPEIICIVIGGDFLIGRNESIQDLKAKRKKKANRKRFKKGL